MIVQVAGVPADSRLGMGRIALEWKMAFEKKGYQFVHLSENEIGAASHPILFGLKARRYIKKQNWKVDLILAHEPIAGWLKFKAIPLVSFSHGVEERRWQVQNQFKLKRLSIKSKLLPQCLRFWPNNNGFKKADKILLSNKTDKKFLIDKGIEVEKINIFTNGYYSFPLVGFTNNPVFLFNGTWLKRKGIELLVNVFNTILNRYPNCRLRITGSAFSKEIVFKEFHSSVHNQIEFIPSFKPEDEPYIYEGVTAFLLPSYFEGQSLALTQAMAMGICPIVSDNSGQLDFVQHQQNGLLFQTGNAESFLEQIEWSIANPLETRDLGMNARHSVSHLTWEVVAGEVVANCLDII